MKEGNRLKSVHWYTVARSFLPFSNFVDFLLFLKIGFPDYLIKTRVQSRYLRIQNLSDVTVGHDNVDIQVPELLHETQDTPACSSYPSSHENGHSEASVHHHVIWPCGMVKLQEI